MHPSIASSSGNAPEPKVLPLQTGDHLGAAEFLRRYEASGEEVRAELINGVVYIMLPAHFEAHGKPDSILSTWLGHYTAFAPDVEHATAATVKLSRLDVPQPDHVLFIKAEAGGSCRITPDDYLLGAPEFVAEVSASSASCDSREKLQAYLRAGVREYLIWRTYDRAVDWFVLRQDDYVQLEPDTNGVLRSPHLAGLWLNTQALLAGNRRQLLRTLDEGLRASGSEL